MCDGAVSTAVFTCGSIPSIMYSFGKPKSDPAQIASEGWRCNPAPVRSGKWNPADRGPAIAFMISAVSRTVFVNGPT